MLDFIKTNLSSILVVLLFIVGLLFIYKNGKKEFVNQVVLSLVVQAEKTLGSGTGELKYAMVIEEIYFALPSIIRFLITKKELDIMIENSVKYLKEYLNDGKDLLGYEDEYMKMLKFNQ
ncbi:hypothetical protein [Tissierella creatinophila]|uniref:Uncharacterized protein n=1 Tax=Tissierella creatinophila DSM 6911 TaxID=1123403 RepID=A0A1U7M6N2_TISCR|nr:hypothetical protein [Tissierella creatinophila]OLS02869.1 hypothetical protein TICRE_11420 [Tissierella creatinophila DSM 6911]